MTPLTGSPDIVASIKRRLLVLTIAVLFLSVCVGGGVVYVAVTASKTHDALCTFRADLQQRVTQTETYLNQHPEGFPGVSVATIQQGLENQKRTIAALGPLGCS